MGEKDLKLFLENSFGEREEKGDIQKYELTFYTEGLDGFEATRPETITISAKVNDDVIRKLVLKYTLRQRRIRRLLRRIHREQVRLKLI